MNNARKKQMLLDLGEKLNREEDKHFDLWEEEVALRKKKNNLLMRQAENHANILALLDQLIKISQTYG